MKTLSLLAAAAAALSLGLSAHGGVAATYKPNVSVQPMKPVQPAAVAYLACKIVIPAPAGARLDVATARITNTTGVMLKKGMRIHVSYQLKNGLLTKTSFILPKNLPVGASTEILAGGLNCTAQVNLLAKLEPVPTVPVPR